MSRIPYVNWKWKDSFRNDPMRSVNTHTRFWKSLIVFLCQTSYLGLILSSGKVTFCINEHRSLTKLSSFQFYLKEKRKIVYCTYLREWPLWGISVINTVLFFWKNKKHSAEVSIETFITPANRRSYTTGHLTWFLR